MICFITGGARSGKTSYAQKQALQLSNTPVYIATAKKYPDDKEFEKRIQRHQQERDERWTSYEELYTVSRLPILDRVVVIDCVTLWLSNFFSTHKGDIDSCLNELKNEIAALKKMNTHFFIISNEIGMGVHAEHEISRKFTDLQGWANQYIAQEADKVILMVSGIPLTIKETNETQKLF